MTEIKMEEKKLKRKQSGMEVLIVKLILLFF